MSPPSHPRGWKGDTEAMRQDDFEKMTGNLTLGVNSMTVVELKESIAPIARHER
jgi:hypothetical protein